MNIAQRYDALYTKVEDEVKPILTIERLDEVCSIELDQTGKKDQVNVTFLLTDNRTIREVKIRFDKYAPGYGLTIDYTNLGGYLPMFDK